MLTHKPRAVLAALMLFAGAAQAETARLDGTPMFPSGEDAWNKVCAQCHSGREDSVGPNLFHGFYDLDVVTYFARHGSGPMPAFTAAMIDDETLSQIAAHIIANHEEPAQ